MSFKVDSHLVVRAAFMSYGIAIHQGLFIRGEWHSKAPDIAKVHVFLFFALAAVINLTQGTAWSRAFQAAISISLGYSMGIFFSMSIYRVFFHRLTKAGFRGPWYACVSKLWHVWACLDSKNHVVLGRLNNKYGDFVRTGPSEITVFRPEIFMAVDGPHSKCKKSDWYDLLLPNLALVTSREKAVHAPRRRQWNRAFSTQALQLHHARILRHINELDKRLKLDVDAGRITNARDMFYWFAFDSMGDFVLGKPFGMQQTQKWHHLIVRLQRALSLLGPLSPTPWLIQLFLHLGPPVLQLKDWFDMVAWCRRQMRDRVNDQSRHQEKDITHYIMMEDGESEETIQNALLWLSGDSLQAIVAGSGPIANALMGLFTEMGRTPGVWDKLYEEVKDVEGSDIKTLSNLPFLNACITETLRLYPALITGGNRMTTEEGIMVAGTFIPPFTNIVAPQYLISRREDCFVHPCKFIPERWTTKPELVLNPFATKPFGTGHTSCVGRPLAVDALRLTVTRIVKKYTFKYAPAEDGSGMGSGLRDQFVPNPGSLKLCFSGR